MRLLLLPLLLLSQLAPAQTLRKDLRRDFGAVGNGRTDDQAAFHRAAEFFNQRPKATGRAVLRIPAGTYLVGRPGQPMPDLLPLRGCRNLTIVGDDSATTEIRYADSLRYGAFDPATRLPYEAPTAWFSDWKYAATLGIAISLQQCDNVLVANLTLNGNSPHLVVGGHWGDVGIQLAADGLFVSDSRHVQLRNLAVHRFGRDGIQVLNHLTKTVDDPAQDDIVLENSRFDYNGRQGISITGVNGLQATNCSFSHTGRVVVPALGKALFSNPGAGVDLEPEGAFVTNVLLDNCRFVDNAGQGVGSDRYGNGPPTTKHILLKNCLIWGLTNWSVWVRQTDFQFENCRIYGAFVTGCAFAAYATRFVGCTFEDRPYHGQAAYGPYLLYSRQEARAMRFTRCRFVATHGALLLAVPAAPDTASCFRLHDCTFVLNQDGPATPANQLAGAVFSGRTTWETGPARADSLRSSFVLGTPAASLVAVLPGGSLHLRAAHSRYLLPGGLDVGRPPGRGAATVLVGSGNELVMGEEAELYIGPASRLVVQKGGTLTVPAHARLTIAGQVVVEAGGHFYQDPQALVQVVGHGQVKR